MFLNLLGFIWSISRAWKCLWQFYPVLSLFLWKELANHCSHTYHANSRGQFVFNSLPHYFLIMFAHINPSISQLLYSSLSVSIFSCISLEKLKWKTEHQLGILYYNYNGIKCILRWLMNKNVNNHIRVWDCGWFLPNFMQYDCIPIVGKWWLLGFCLPPRTYK